MVPLTDTLFNIRSFTLTKSELQVCDFDSSPYSNFQKMCCCYFDSLTFNCQLPLSTFTVCQHPILKSFFSRNRISGFQLSMWQPTKSKLQVYWILFDLKFKKAVSLFVTLTAWHFIYCLTSLLHSGTKSKPELDLNQLYSKTNLQSLRSLLSLWQL